MSTRSKSDWNFRFQVDIIDDILLCDKSIFTQASINNAVTNVEFILNENMNYVMILYYRVWLYS